MRARAALLALLLTSACAHRPPAAPVGWPAQTDWIVDGRTGEVSTYDAMVADLADADVVFVGEDHDNPHHHEIQRRILSSLADRRAGLGLGMEMLQKHSQPQADQFTAGSLDVDGLAKAVEWRRTWGFSFAWYRPVFEVARAHKLPLFALNADDEEVHRVSKVGLSGLSPEEKASLPELDLKDPHYREFVKTSFSSHHAMPADAFERFFAAQVLWDETMASRTVEAMKQGDKPRPMFVMAGTGHLVQRMGIPSRVERRVPGVKTRVVLPLAATKKSRPNFKKSAAEKDCDWVWVTPEPEDDLPGSQAQRSP